MKKFDSITRGFEYARERLLAGEEIRIERHWSPNFLLGIAQALMDNALVSKRNSMPKPVKSYIVLPRNIYTAYDSFASARQAAVERATDDCGVAFGVYQALGYAETPKPANIWHSMYES